MSDGSALPRGFPIGVATVGVQISTGGDSAAVCRQIISGFRSGDRSVLG